MAEADLNGLGTEIQAGGYRPALWADVYVLADSARSMSVSKASIEVHVTAWCTDVVRLMCDRCLWAVAPSPTTLATWQATLDRPPL